jgi:ketosteroid isomerase-like protein
VADEPIQALRDAYTAMQRQDAEQLSEVLAHDIEWTLPEGLPWGGTHHGHLGVVSVVEIFLESVDGFWADPDEFIDAGDRVVVLGRIMGRVRATGREFEVEFAHVWGLTDGVPSRFRGYYDTAPIVTALGDI